MIHALIIDFERTVQWLGVFGDLCVMGVYSAPKKLHL